jgi:hypothetical protein
MDKIAYCSSSDSEESAPVKQVKQPAKLPSIAAQLNDIPIDFLDTKPQRPVI